MYDILDFIRWALMRVQKGCIPAGALLALSDTLCAREPWQYLFGSIRVMTTQANIDRFYSEHYSKQMSREEYDAITAKWSRTGYATDCEGLLDAWLTYEMDDPTDLNSEGNYRQLCTDKGPIADIDRPFVIGEAVFRQNSAGRMSHVGWVCGFDGTGPLVVEARNIRYGVTVSRLAERDFTHRGLMTKLFSYGEAEKMKPIKLELTSPVMSGNAILALQYALNELGYTDADGRALSEDGKCGRRTMYAVEQFANAQQTACRTEAPGPAFELPSLDGDYVMKVKVEAKQTN